MIDPLRAACTGGAFVDLEMHSKALAGWRATGRCITGSESERKESCSRETAK